MALNRKLMVASALFVGMLAAAILPAWACTRQARLTITPSHGIPGETVTVEGWGWNGAQPVEIRWNSDDGPLAVNPPPTPAGDNPSFAVALKVPQMEDGVYYLVATSRIGSEVFRASHSFTVGSPWDARAGADGTSWNEDPAAQSRGAAFGGAGSSSGAPSGSDSQGPASEIIEGAGAEEAMRGETPGQAAAETVAGSALEQPAGSSASGLKEGPVSAPAVGRDEVSRLQSGAPAPVRSARSASNDLWRGFGAGVPGLDVDADGIQPGADAAGASALAGAALMVVGSMILLGFSVALARRRQLTSAA